jgi:hypothetical protein
MYPLKGVQKESKMGLGLWKILSDVEEETFREWARNNFKPGDIINTTWHPIVQVECQKINEESGGCCSCAKKGEYKAGFCPTCSFWISKINLTSDDIVIIGHKYYTIPDYEDLYDYGRIKIKFDNGRILRVNYLKFHGKIPERFQQVFNNNAIFIEGGE